MKKSQANKKAAVDADLLTLPTDAGRAIVEVGAVIACPLLGTDRFVKFCRERGISISRERYPGQRGHSQNHPRGVETMIAVTDKKINISGGHNVPEPVIRRQFAAGLHNFSALYKPIVDEWALYDNSGSTPLLLKEGVKR